MAQTEFRLLGPLEVLREGEQVVVSGRKLRTLLAMLLVARNRHVTQDRLAQQLWDEEQPGKARSRLHALVLRLRSLLEPERGPREEQMLFTQPDGYILNVSGEQVDADRFENLFADARRAYARGNAATAFQTVREALDLWHRDSRGDALPEALADFAADPFAEREAVRLNRSYSNATELWLTTGLSLGRPEDLEDLMREFKLLVRDPLPEKLLEWLITDLSQAGRLQDALAVCRDQQRTYVQKCDADLPPAIQALRESVAKYELPAMRPPPSRHADDPDGDVAYPHAEAQALNNLGIVYFRQHRYDDAIKYYEQARAIYEKSEATYGLAQTLDNLAGAYEAKGDRSEALEHWNKAFQLFRQVGAPEVDRVWSQVHLRHSRET